LAHHRAACAVEAAMIAATAPGTSWESVLKVGQRAYGEAGYPDEWKLHWQGGPIAYNSREYDVVPGTRTGAAAIILGSAFAWNPTVQGGKSEDTFILTDSGARPVSNTTDWPELTIETPAGALARPAILAL
jgi:antitoxin VapB